MTTRGTDRTTTGGGILRSRPRYSAVSKEVIDNNAETTSSAHSLPFTSTASACDGNHQSVVAATARTEIIMSEEATSTLASISSSSGSSNSRPKVRTLADLASSSTSLSSEASGIPASERGNVATHKPRTISGNTTRREGDNNHLSLQSTLHISEKGTPYIKEISGSGPDNIVDADSVIALGVMGEDGQQVRFCEYVDEAGENVEGCASSSRDRLGQRINSEVDEDDFDVNAEVHNSDSDGSSSLGSEADEEILHELGLSELILDDDDFGCEESEARIAMDSKNLRSFRILWELLSRWATPSTVELVLHFQGNRSPSQHQDGSSTNPPLEQCTTDVETSECSRNTVIIGASRQASIMSMLKMHIPRSLSELTMMQRGTENSIDQRNAEQRLADLVRTFDPSAPAADLNMKYWKGLTTILIAIAFPCEYPTSSAIDANDELLLPPSIQSLSMASSEYRYLTRSVFSSLSGIADRSTDEVI